MPFRGMPRGLKIGCFLGGQKRGVLRGVK